MPCAEAGVGVSSVWLSPLVSCHFCFLRHNTTSECEDECRCINMCIHSHCMYVCMYMLYIDGWWPTQQLHPSDTVIILLACYLSVEHSWLA